MRKSYLAERNQFVEIPEEKRKKLVTQGMIFICAGGHTNDESTDEDLREGYIYHFNQELPADDQDEIFRDLI